MEKSCRWLWWWKATSPSQRLGDVIRGWVKPRLVFVRHSTPRCLVASARWRESLSGRDDVVVHRQKEEGACQEGVSLAKQIWPEVVLNYYDTAVMRDRMRPPGLVGVPCRRRQRLVSSLSPRVPAGKTSLRVVLRHSWQGWQCTQNDRTARAHNPRSRRLPKIKSAKRAGDNELIGHIWWWYEW